MPLIKQKKPRRNLPEFRATIIIPIYGAQLSLYVYYDIRKKVKDCPEFGIIEDQPNDCAYACCNNSGEFAIFLSHRGLQHGIIAHEVFHITHEVFDYIGDKFMIDNHEHYTYLCEWITNWIYEELDNHDIEIVRIKEND